MWGVTKDDDVWDGGKILDPKSGKVYKVKLKMLDGGQKLDVHGYIGFALLGRSQVWERQHNPGDASAEKPAACGLFRAPRPVSRRSAVWTAMP